MTGGQTPSRSLPPALGVGRDGFDIRGRDWNVQSVALRLVAPDVRCAEKKVR
jgi:hypothetical protein